MAKNLIPQIAKMLDVELGEKFKIQGHEGLTYRFNLDGLSATRDNGTYVSATDALAALVSGELEIMKLSWKPQLGDSYYSFCNMCGKWFVLSYTWEKSPWDIVLEKKQERHFPM